MAGIGFKLQKMLSEDTYFGTIRAFIYAAAISSGPWLFTIISIGCLSFFSSLYLKKTEIMIFNSIIVYSYAFSLIITGIIQMVTTRYISDKFYSKESYAILPAYFSSLTLATILQTCIGILFYSFFDFPPHVSIIAILLYILISDIWIAMIFLSTLQNYRGILISFLTGAIGSMIVSVVFGRYFGFIGMLTGFTIGQAIIFLLLSRNIVSEFSFTKSITKEYLSYFSLFPQLAIIGFVYNLAIWIDKMVFWFGKPGEQIYSLLYFCPVYDTTIYIAYIMTVPTLALFIIKLETGFYRQYMDFYNAISNKYPLRIIKERKKTVVKSIYNGFQQVLKLQGLITLSGIIFADFIIDILKMDWKLIAILRISFLSSFLHVLLLFLTILVLYFDFRNLCMGIALLFLSTNALFSYISILLGFPYYGYGYLLSCLISLLVGFILFARKIDSLEYLTFMQQPVISDSE